MSMLPGDSDKMDRVLHHDPSVTVFLKPIAPPAALGLAGFAGSTWIVASWIAGWWGDMESPTLFFPFVTFWGGLAQFIAGLWGYPARDTLVTVVHVLWGSFWMSTGLLWLLVAIGTVPPHDIHEHSAELASWFTILTFFTWSAAVASAARDLILCGVLTTLAIGSTIACALFAYGNGVSIAMHVAAYFWIVSAILAWWRVTLYLLEEAYGHTFTSRLPLFKMPREKRKALIVPGFGEPGVNRGMSGVA